MLTCITAIAFGYFENLVRCGDIAQLQRELARLRGLDDYIEKIGNFERAKFEDMNQETFDLFDEVITAMSNGQDCMQVVMEKFNDAFSSQAIIYHLRFLVAAGIKGVREEDGRLKYPKYMEEALIDTPHLESEEEKLLRVAENYINTALMPVDREIDAICIQVLVDILLEPANMGLEIAYLDRSNGVEVNVHGMVAEANGQNPAGFRPIIYLLYRPGHYDILYRDAVLQPPPPPAAPIDLQVNRVDSFTHHQDIQSAVPSLQNFSTMDMGALSMIPAFEPAGISPLMQPVVSSPMSAGYAPSPQSPWIPQPFVDPLQATVPVSPPQPSPPQHPPATMNTHPLRFSKWNFPDLPEMAENAASYEPAFTTNTFKNSHFNVAHYSNNNFQPEMYRPEAEDPPLGRSGGRKRSTDHAAVKKEPRG